MTQENRRWVHPRAIARDEKSGQRPLFYFQNWQHFVLSISDFALGRSLTSHSVEIDSAPNTEFDAVADKIAKEGYSKLSAEEQSTFVQRPLERVHPVDARDVLHLQGWASIEGQFGNISISAFDVEGFPKWKSETDAPLPDLTFDRVLVSIRSSSEAKLGSLFVWNGAARELDRDPSLPQEDYLRAEIYVPHDRLAILLDDLRHASSKPRLVLNVQALLFRDEVESSLSELWHPRHLALLAQESTALALEGINYSVMPSFGQETVTPESILAELEAPKLNSKSTPVAASRDYTSIKHAIWLLAAAVLLAAYIG